MCSDDHTRWKEDSVSLPPLQGGLFKGCTDRFVCVVHFPLYVPYKLYGETDYVYGWKAFNARSGFTAAQGSLNVIETAMYLAYLYIYFNRGTPVGGVLGGEKRVLQGRAAGFAVLLAFSAAVMTLSKTVLYCESLSLAASRLVIYRH